MQITEAGDGIQPAITVAPALPLILSIIDTEVIDATQIELAPAPRVEQTVAQSEEDTCVESAHEVHTTSTVMTDVDKIHVRFEMKCFEVTLSVIYIDLFQSLCEPGIIL